MLGVNPINPRIGILVVVQYDSSISITPGVISRQLRQSFGPCAHSRESSWCEIIYMYIYIYVYVYVCIYVYIYICVCVCSFGPCAHLRESSWCDIVIVSININSLL